MQEVWRSAGDLPTLRAAPPGDRRSGRTGSASLGGYLAAGGLARAAFGLSANDLPGCDSLTREPAQPRAQASSL